MNPLRLLARRLLSRRSEQAVRKLLFRARSAGFRPRTVPVDRPEGRFAFYVGDPVGGTWIRKGWDWEEVAYLHQHVVRPGDVVLECGAHHGELTVFFSQWVGASGHVVALDPIPRNRAIVEENVRINALQNVTVEGKAVGATPGTTVMTDESNAQVAGPDGIGIPVPVTTVDAYASLSPTVVKVDVEGFELEVLRGASAVLAQRPRLAIELHPHAMTKFGASPEAIVMLLEPYGYRLLYRRRGAPMPVSYTGEPILEDGHLFAFPEDPA